MSVWRVVVAALVAGLLVGVAVAVAVPTERGASEPDLPPAAGPAELPKGKPAEPGDPARPATAPERPQPSSLDFERVRLRGRPSIVVRTKDPRGGPDWAIRLFHGNRLSSRDRVLERRLCAQLGRIHGGRFGWIDAANTFRPVSVGTRRAPTTCEGRAADSGENPYVEVFTRITDPKAGVSEPLQSVVWGLAGDATTLALRLRGARAATPRAPHGAFIAVAGPEVRPFHVDGTIRHPDGNERQIGGARALSLARKRAESYSGEPGGRPEVGVAPVIEARAADPHGGLAWGVGAVREPTGSWCLTSPGRIVGDRIGDVEHELGILYEGRETAQRCSRERVTKRMWYGGITSGSGDLFGGTASDPEAGRAARRTLPGRTFLYGSLHEDVEQVTVATPRDVRTLTPSPRTHAVLLVFDGTFPTGNVKLTARMKDGSRKRVAFPF